MGDGINECNSFAPTCNLFLIHSFEFRSGLNKVASRPVQRLLYEEAMLLTAFNVIRPTESQNSPDTLEVLLASK